MKDSCGFEITEGFYSDSEVFHYYYVKQTSEGLFIRESKEEQYTLLKGQQSITSRLIRLIRQDELIRLIDSVEKEQDAQSQPKYTLQELLAPVHEEVLKKGKHNTRRYHLSCFINL